MAEENKENEDFINEKISIGEYVKPQLPITETDFTKDLNYQQNEFKPTVFRYIRLMNKENVDKNGNAIIPDFSYDTKEFSSVSYKYIGNFKNNQQETIRRIQKTKLCSDSYPFGELVPSNKKKDGSVKKNEKKSKKDETSLKNDDKNKKKVLNVSQQRHYNVQNFSIIILCLIINAFCCIIYYTSDWPDVVKRLPNQIELSKIIINNSFVFTGDKLFLQKDNDLSGANHHIIIKNLDYGNIHIDASHMDSRVRCNTVRSNGDSLTIGFINFTLLNSQNAIQMSTSNHFDTISISMDVSNVNLLDLSKAKSIFNEENDAVSNVQLLDSQQIYKDKEKKTLLRRSINSGQNNKILYDNNYNELYFIKLFEIKKNAFYLALFDNSTLSLLHVVSPLSLNERPKISSNSDLNENNNFILNCSTIISSCCFFS